MAIKRYTRWPQSLVTRCRDSTLYIFRTTKFNSGIEFCECNILVVVWKMYKVKYANAQQTRTVYILTPILLMWGIEWTPNPLASELNPLCKSQLSELFCGVFKFRACFSKDLNISRNKRDKFVKQKAVCREWIIHCSECLNSAVISLLRNVEDTFQKILVNIHVLLLTLWSRLQLFARRKDEKMCHKLSFVW
jgi:hypothetical protein